MAGFTLTRHVAAPPDAVFDCAADFERAPQRMRGITNLELLTEGPVGPGTRFRETRLMFGREATEEMQVTEFERPNRYVVECESCGCHYRSEFRFQSAGDGTDVVLAFEATPRTLLARLTAFLMKPMLEACAKETAKDLEDLQNAVEADTGRHQETQPATN